MPLDPHRNPYTPGAGQNPPLLSGREHEVARFGTTLSRLARGRSAQRLLVVGLRGVGKTVLLNRFARDAVRQEWVVVEHELRPDGDLFATTTRMVRDALLQLAPPSAWRSAGRRLAALLRGIEASCSLAGLTITARQAEGDDRAPSMDRAQDLTDLLVELGETAREHDRGVAMFFDELQFAATDTLGALVTALHKVAQRELPVTMVAAGLPQTRGVLAEAASCAERMFTLVEVGPLEPEQARLALLRPAEDEGVSYTAQALDLVVDFTEGYPCFLQLFGDLVWQHAASSPITVDDARRTVPLVRSASDGGFFLFRTGRLPLAQRRYLRAMAEGERLETASGEVAERLGMTSSAQAGQTRDALIRKGLIYSPRLGFAAFTVPHFDDYLRRTYELERHDPSRRPS